MGWDRSICFAPSDSTATNSGIAGAGILVSFLTTAGVAILLSTFIVFKELPGTKKARISRKILEGFVDTQILAGNVNAIVAFAKGDTIVPYHFFEVWLSTICSNITHAAAMLVLYELFQGDKTLRRARQFLMLLTWLMSSLNGGFLIRIIYVNMAPTSPWWCSFQVPVNRNNYAPTFPIIATVGAISGLLVVFVLSSYYLNSKWLTNKSRKFVQLGGMVILLACFIGAAIRMIMVSQAFGNPGVKLTGPSEGEWTYGQIVPLILLLLPLVNALKIYRQQHHHKEYPVDGSSDHLPLR